MVLRKDPVGTLSDVPPVCLREEVTEVIPSGHSLEVVTE